MLGCLLWTALPPLVIQLPCFIFVCPTVQIHRLHFISLVSTAN